HHHTWLSPEVKEDLQIWSSFLQQFNGAVIWPSRLVASSTLSLFTDAAGSTGFGAVLGSEWCRGDWPADWHDSSITINVAFLELFPIVVAVTVWAMVFRDKSVIFWSNNMAVVEAINRQGTS
ncbi:hypothetical protein NDU88_004658, partial [Pleurodeles waltl]